MPRLVIKRGEGVGRDHVLGVGPCVVGRDTSCDFALGDKLASRRHFQVTAEAGAWWLEDLGSTNGTVVNGRKVGRAQLVDGDQIQAGATTLAYVQKDLLAPKGGPAAAAAPTPASDRPQAPDAPKPSTGAPVRTRRRR